MVRESDSETIVRGGFLDSNPPKEFGISATNRKNETMSEAECKKDQLPDKLLELVEQWNNLVPEKWREHRKNQGVFISFYSPQWTHKEDMFRRRQASCEIKKWTESWFREHGYEIECVILADGESLAIREDLQIKHFGGIAKNPLATRPDKR